MELAQRAKNFDQVIERLQGQVDQLAEERREWLAQRSEQPTIVDVMEMLQKIMKEMIALRSAQL